MKRTNYVTRLISLLLFLFLLVYFGASAIRSLQNPLRTIPATLAHSEERFFAQGLIIRDEHLIHTTHPIVSSLVREGERVSVGMAYLVAYESELARDQSARRQILTQEIAELEAQLAQDGGFEESLGTEAAIRREIRSLSQGIHANQLVQLETHTIRLRALALAGDRDGLSTRLSTLRAELSELGDANAPTQHIVATQAGVFSTRVDGFEHLRVDDLMALSVGEFEEKLDTQTLATQTDAGKLITSTTWFYLALVPEEELAALYLRYTHAQTNRLLVSFAGVDTVDIPMRVYAMGEAEDGYALVAFASTTALADTLGSRQVEGRILYHSFSGFRVPHGAVYHDTIDEDGTTVSWVFTLTVGTAEQKFVRVVYTGADYYLIMPDNNRTNQDAALRAGNHIIVRGRNLYDGRVVAR